MQFLFTISLTPSSNESSYEAGRKIKLTDKNIASRDDENGSTKLSLTKNREYDTEVTTTPTVYARKSPIQIFRTFKWFGNNNKLIIFKKYWIL